MKRCVLLVLFLAVLLLGGCTAAPPDSVIRSDADRSALISAEADALAPDAVQAALYFRYEDTGLLAPEERIISVLPNETREKALVQALIDGPAATSSALSPLFPAGTQVLAVTSQDQTLYVTFNEALLGRYVDEPVDASAAPWRDELPLRRKLCMDSLTATLTEAGLCNQVQVLVYRSNVQASSMRLQAGFFDRSFDETLLEPFTRNENVLMTPHNAASALLKAWMEQDWPTLYGWIARDTRPGEQAALDSFSSARILTGFDVTPGTVSLDGKRAVLCADLTMRSQGEDWSVRQFPLHFIREEGLWKMTYDRLDRLIGGQ